MGRSLAEGPAVALQPALSSHWSHAVGPTVPAWGMWGNGSPQKPKGQTSLSHGDWHGGVHWGLTAEATFGRQNSVTPPGVTSVMGGVRTQPGSGRENFRRSSFMGNGKGRSNSGTSGACCHFLPLPASSSSSSSSNQTIFCGKKIIDSGALPFVAPPAAASFVCSYRCIHELYMQR